MVQTQTYKRAAQRVLQARKKKKLSLEKVAKSLGVPASTIRSLENELESDIPDSNAPGLYRRYAKLLGIDAPTMNGLLEIERTHKNFWSRSKAQRVKKQIFLSRVGSGMLIAIVLTSVSAYALWQLLVLTSAPRLTVEQPPHLSVVSEASLVIKGSSQNDATVLVNGDPVPLNEDVSFETTIYLQEGYNTIDISAINAFSREAREQRIVHFTP